MSFRRDLSVGNKAEAFIQMVFASHKVKTETNKEQSKLSHFDMIAKFPANDVKMESKFDLFCARSGNIAIEFYNPKTCKPSGVNITCADLWVHMITEPVSAWITSVPLLKEYIKTVKPHRVVTCGGDDNSSMYLYKKDVIFPAIFHRIDECSENEFMTNIDSLLSIKDMSEELKRRGVVKC